MTISIDNIRSTTKEILELAREAASPKVFYDPDDIKSMSTEAFEISSGNARQIQAKAASILTCLEELAEAE